MKNILVPTDFSENSKNALQFAEILAKQFDVEIDLLHVHHPKMAELEGITIEVEGFKYLSSKLRDIAMESDYFAKINRRIEEGFASDIILSNSNEYSYIVIGSTGNNPAKKWLGSVTLVIGKKAKCPVIIIPPDFEPKPFKKLGYAYDQSIDDAYQIESLLKSEAIDVLPFHIQQQNGGDPRKEKTDNPIGIGADHYIIHATSIEEGMNAAFDMLDLDVIAMERQRRSILSRLLFGSPTIEAMTKVHAPLIILHD
ncbi:MAG: universal stress protein [Bacteroidia bacterium]|nr:universal stress protein [Bacteroidia bacterium]